MENCNTNWQTKRKNDIVHNRNVQIQIASNPIQHHLGIYKRHVQREILLITIEIRLYLFYTMSEFGLWCSCTFFSCCTLVWETCCEPMCWMRDGLGTDVTQREHTSGQETYVTCVAETNVCLSVVLGIPAAVCLSCCQWLPHCCKSETVASSGLEAWHKRCTEGFLCHCVATCMCASLDFPACCLLKRLSSQARLLTDDSRDGSP